MALAFAYPSMFRYCVEGDGKRAVDKIDIQAGKMCDRVSHRAKILSITAFNQIVTKII